MKTMLSAPDHTIILTGKKEVRLLQVSESIVTRGENFSEILKRNWQNTFIHSLLK